ncbi:hypothetical protein TNCV_1132181 [Trichonephila clavipes]|nr:hypothetical protein TNCV_1132181 [Trichonephila clavipes]
MYDSSDCHKTEERKANRYSKEGLRNSNQLFPPNAVAWCFCLCKGNLSPLVVYAKVYLSSSPVDPPQIVAESCVEL